MEELHILKAKHIITSHIWADILSVNIFLNLVLLGLGTLTHGGLDTPYDNRSWLTKVQVVTCQTALTYYLNQCWPLIAEFLWHMPESNFTV